VIWTVDGSRLLSRRAFIRELDRVSGELLNFGEKLESMTDQIYSLGSPPLSGRNYWLVWRYPDVLLQESPTEFYQVYDCLAGGAKELIVGNEREGEIISPNPAYRARLDVLLLYRNGAILRESLPSLRTLDKLWQDTFYSLELALDTEENCG